MSSSNPGSSTTESAHNQSSSKGFSSSANLLVVQLSQVIKEKEQIVANVAIDFPSNKSAISKTGADVLRDQITDVVKNFIADPNNFIEPKDKKDVSTQTFHVPTPITETAEADENQERIQSATVSNELNFEPLVVKFEIFAPNKHENIDYVMPNLDGVSMDDIDIMREAMANELTSLIASAPEDSMPSATVSSLNSTMDVKTSDVQGVSVKNTKEEIQHVNSSNHSSDSDSQSTSFDPTVPSTSSGITENRRIRRKSDLIDDKIEGNDAKKYKKNEVTKI
ncbi:unnamed protein product [Caenorhabditis bovis]|uniref:Uncharacterized protein n=1 Tax=Caenorhabditis bovis TaxID=2654633 RepID=A0A8S1FCH9_9PELO|nr:unnamed protein product [Caenorhabditis bovis]